MPNKWNSGYGTTFNTGFGKGYDIYEARLDEERKRKAEQHQADLLLRNAQANEGVLTPGQVNRMTLSQGANGLEFPTTTETGEPLEFKKKKDPNQVIMVSEEMGKVLGLSPGGHYQWEIDQAGKKSRAETLAGGQTERTAMGITRDNVRDAMKAADDQVAAFLKTIGGQIATPEKLKEIR